MREKTLNAAKHRKVAEWMLGRPLLPGEHVHHANHDHSDNRVDNLIVLTPSEHAKHHARYNRYQRYRLDFQIARDSVNPSEILWFQLSKLDLSLLT